MVSSEILPSWFSNACCSRRRRTTANEASMAASHGADWGKGGGANNSSGTWPSQIALWIGLLVV